MLHTFLRAHRVEITRREASRERSVESTSSLLVQHVVLLVLLDFRLVDVLLRLQRVERSPHRRVRLLVVASRHLRSSYLVVGLMEEL